MNKFIVVTGPEGVGKTTQIRNLLEKIKSNSVYGYVRSGSLPVRLIKKFLVEIGRVEKTFTELGDLIVDADHHIVSRLINLFLILDYFTALAKIFYYLLLGRLGYIIVFERYLNDLVLDYYYATLHYRVDERILRFTGKTLSALSRWINPLIIVLDADIDTLLDRQRRRRRSDLLIFTYIQKRLHVAVAEYMSSRVYVLDTTNKSIEDVNARIRDLVWGDRGCLRECEYL